MSYSGDVTQIDPPQALAIVSVREFMKFKPIELLHGLRTNMIVRFDDNVDIVMSHKEIILCRYLYEIFEYIPSIPITSVYCISKYYTNGIYTAKTINKLLEVMLESIVVNILRPNMSRALLSVIYQQMQRIYNDIYNNVVFDWVEYASSINIRLFLELQFKPELLDAMREVKETKSVHAVMNTYKILDRIMHENTHNSLMQRQN